MLDVTGMMELVVVTTLTKLFVHFVNALALSPPNPSPPAPTSPPPTTDGCGAPEWATDAACDDENNNSACNFDDGLRKIVKFLRLGMGF